ncbi:unnamed protein product [Owenia fusiformis]|uniref:Serine/threonine-protein kinase PLK4 n=1 Tax=Owenia fusiformis TaxID=6347 RepID=A0A8J1TG12_OWEFU|nr:unnamed protein product [Owenia fusiformis]
MGESIEDFQVLNLLGRGGFACVYRARCKSTGQEVAIKMIDKKLMTAAGMVARVKKEVEIQSRLKHPSILELYNYFEDEHYVYLVLEMCHNGELYRYLKTNCKVFTEDEGRHYMKQIVDGMLYLHGYGILHRDLTLANLLLTRDMDVKIADFGLATQLSVPEEKHFTMCGTPNYISPEIAMRGAHGLESDVWSLGCMLYTMLVGRPPFDTQGVKTTLNKVILADFDMPANLSPEAKHLIHSLLKKAPKDRLKITDILSHPFMTRQPLSAYTHNDMRKPMVEASMDSGRDTMATISTTIRSSHSRQRPFPAFPVVTQKTSDPNLDFLERDKFTENKFESRPQDGGYTSQEDKHYGSHPSSPMPYGNHPPSPPVRLRDTESGVPQKPPSPCATEPMLQKIHAEHKWLNELTKKTTSTKYGIPDRENGPSFKANNYSPYSDKPFNEISQGSACRSNPREDYSNHKYGHKSQSDFMHHDKDQHSDFNFHDKENQYNHRSIDKDVNSKFPKSNDYSGYIDSHKSDMVFSERPHNTNISNSERPHSTNISNSERPNSTNISNSERPHTTNINRRLGEYDSLVYPRSYESPNRKHHKPNDYSEQPNDYIQKSKDYNSDCYQPTQGFETQISRYDFTDEKNRPNNGRSHQFSEYHQNTTSFVSQKSHNFDAYEPHSEREFMGTNSSAYKRENNPPSPTREYRDRDGPSRKNVHDINTVPNPTVGKSYPERQVDCYSRQTNHDRIYSSTEQIQRSQNIKPIKHFIHNPDEQKLNDRNLNENNNCEVPNLGSNGSKEVVSTLAPISKSVAPEKALKKSKSRLSKSLSDLTSPIKAERLRPIRQKTRNAVVNILENGEVCLEFIKSRDQNEFIVEVFRIAADGQKVTVYQPKTGKSTCLGERPPSPPTTGGDTYVYPDIPEKYWKKYQYAARFVKLVRSKTPKVTLYTRQAKCMLMENTPQADFEVLFYDGAKMNKSSEGTKIIEKDGTSMMLDHHGNIQHLAPSTQQLWHYVHQCHRRCQDVEATLGRTQEEDSEQDYFPVIIGRRPLATPTVHPDASTPPRVVKDVTPALKDRPIVSPSIAPTVNPTMVSYDGTVASMRSHLNRKTVPPKSDMVEKSTRKPATSDNTTPNTGSSKLKHQNNHPINSTHDSNNNDSNSLKDKNSSEDFKADVMKHHPVSRTTKEKENQNLSRDILKTEPSRAKSRQESSRERMKHERKGSNSKVVKSVFVAGIGWASQLSNGEVLVQFNDGSQLSVQSSVMRVKYVDPSGKTFRYSESDVLPGHVKEKLEKLPHVVETLVSTPNQVPVTTPNSKR